MLALHALIPIQELSSVMNRISLFLLAFWLFCVNGVQSKEVNEPIPVASSQTDVYVIPITDAISTPNL